MVVPGHLLERHVHAVYDAEWKRLKRHVVRGFMFAVPAATLLVVGMAVGMPFLYGMYELAGVESERLTFVGGMERGQEIVSSLWRYLLIWAALAASSVFVVTLGPRFLKRRSPEVYQRWSRNLLIYWRRPRRDDLV